jgi:RNA polymerase sigma-70 factor (ECF subfamily)
MESTERRARFEAVVADAYEPLQRYLIRRCAADDVDDVLNETLLAIWRRLDAIPSGKTLPWCYGVARHCLANSRRGSMRRLRLVDRIESNAPRPADPELTAEADVELHEALARLGELDREVIRLWAWEQLEPREIAEALGATPNAISVRLARIRRALNRELSRQNRAIAGHEQGDGLPEMEP